MGAIARSAANNITTSGVFTSSAIANSSVTGITVLANASDGITLISSQTASNSASLSFTTGLDSTYKAYKFVFSNIHPASDTQYFRFQGSTDSGSNYGVTLTSTVFRNRHKEDGNNGEVTYESGDDLAQSTSFQTLGLYTGGDADQSSSGTLMLFNPSSTTYVKHFISDVNVAAFDDSTINYKCAGYFNTTSAINALRFKMDSGNIESGTIYLYGIK